MGEKCLTQLPGHVDTSKFVVLGGGVLTLNKIMPNEDIAIGTLLGISKLNVSPLEGYQLAAP